jgi:hypothetical protein
MLVELNAEEMWYILVSMQCWMDDCVGPTLEQVHILQGIEHKLEDLLPADYKEE